MYFFCNAEDSAEATYVDTVVNDNDDCLRAELCDPFQPHVSYSTISNIHI